MVRILIPIRFQLITDEDIGVVTVRHEGLQLGITQKVRQHVTATRTVLVEEDHHTFNLVDQDPHVAFLITVIFTDLTPRTELSRTVPPQGSCPDGSSSPACGQEYGPEPWTGQTSTGQEVR